MDYAKYSILLVLIFFTTTFFAQDTCYVSNDEPDFDRIFGTPNIYNPGVDTLKIDTNSFVVYSCWNCAIKGFDSKGREKWLLDLCGLGCQLVAFLDLDKEYVRKGYDVVFQLENHEIYILKSKNGRFKYSDLD